MASGRRRTPRLVIDVVLRWQSDAQNAASTFRVLDDGFSLSPTDSAHARQKPPLIGPWVLAFVEEDTVALLTSLFAGLVLQQWIHVPSVVRSLRPDLDANAIAAAKKWRFKPGTRNGEPVAVLVSISMAFTLR